MCDYSLHFVASRPARVADKLVSTRFRNSPTRGFAAIGEPDVAVCLLPGTEVAFERDVECDGAFRFFRGRSLKQKVARFRQINLDEPTMHHDALEFPDGDITLVTELREGQHATVLQLPAPERAPTERACQHDGLIGSVDDRRVGSLPEAPSTGAASGDRVNAATRQTTTSLAFRSMEVDYEKYGFH